MRIGLFRYVATIKKRIMSQGNDGAMVPVWVRFCKGKANVVERSGSNTMVAEGSVSAASKNTQITMRYVDSQGTSPGMKVELNDGRVLTVNSVVDLTGKKVELLLNCVEWVERG